MQCNSGKCLISSQTRSQEDGSKGWAQALQVESLHSFLTPHSHLSTAKVTSKCYTRRNLNIPYPSPKFPYQITPHNCTQEKHFMLRVKRPWKTGRSTLHCWPREGRGNSKPAQTWLWALFLWSCRSFLSHHLTISCGNPHPDFCCCFPVLLAPGWKWMKELESCTHQHEFCSLSAWEYPGVE